MSSANNGRQPTAGEDPRPPDAVLVRRVLEGERDPYRVLIQRHQGRFHRYAIGMVGDPDAATDLVRDSFVRAYTSLDTCPDPSSFGAWAYRILRDRCRDYLAHLDGVPESPQERDEVLSPLDEEAGVDGSDADWTLRDALACLPGAHREAFLLKHLHGHSYGEIAERLGTSLSAVEMRVRRSREILRSYLEKKAAATNGRGRVSPSRRRGFTVLEVLFVLVLVAVTLAAGLRSYSAHLDRTVAERAAKVFAQDLELARAAAIQGREDVVVRFLESERRYVVEAASGREIASRRYDEDAEGELSEIAIDVPGDSVVFDARGFGDLSEVDGAVGTGAFRAARTTFSVSFNAMAESSVDRS